MIDSTNPRILADNVRALSGEVGSQASDISALQATVGKLVMYSTTEYDTGKKWIDDSTIYGKIFVVENPTIGELQTIAHGVSNLGDVTDVHGVAQVDSGFSGKFAPYRQDILITYNGTYIEYSIAQGQSGLKKMYIFFEYTKSASPSPDLAPTPDDTRSIEPEAREEEPEAEPIEEPVVEVKKTTRKKTTTE